MRQILLHRLLFLPILLLMAWAGCQSPSDPPIRPQAPWVELDTFQLPKGPASSYLALGDSYTIGTSVDSSLRWPTQLRDSLQRQGIAVAAPVYIARSGWTTRRLLEAIAVEAYPDTFDLVSLLIGVNDQFQGRPFAVYQEEFLTLIEAGLAAVQQRKERLFVVSIPDYGVTPFGQTRHPEQIAAELDNYNDYARRVCDSLGLLYVYITDISRQAGTQPDLTAPDNLHPSGEQYRRWVLRMRPEVEKVLRE